MASKRPISQEEEDDNGTSPGLLKRSQPCHHCCREAMENLASEIEQRIGRRMQEVHNQMQEEVQSIRLLLNQIAAVSGPRLPISNLNNGVSRFRLHFDNKLPQILFTYRKIEVVGSEPLQIVIRDARSNEIVSSGPFSTLKIRIVVLNGNFCGDGREWTKDAFIKAMIPQRKDKRPLLIGALEYSLSNGVSQPIDAKFTDNSSWSVDGFRLAAMVSDDSSVHVRVLEAISEAFRVKDCRVESNQKVDPPLLNDNVWRLRNIGRDGPLHKKLADAKIDTVQDFLRSLTMDPDRLRELLGRPKKFWDTIVEHARESTLGSKLYSYCIEEKGIVLVFNSIFELVGANINNGFFRPLSALSHSEKELAENLKSVAYKNSENMDEFFGSVDVTSVPGSSVVSPEIYYHSVTSPDDPIRMIGQQQTYLPQNGYSSTEHGFYFHQISSFQMPYSTQALSGPINTNVGLSMHQCPAASTSFPGSCSLQISTLPSQHLDLQHHPESMPNELSGNQYKDISAGESFHCAQQSASYQTNSLDASSYINRGEQNFDCYALCDPIFSDEEMACMTQMLVVPDSTVGTSNIPFSVKWVKFYAAARWVLVFRQSAAKRAKITHLGQQILVPNAQASACGS